MGAVRPETLPIREQGDVSERLNAGFERSDISW
jgi:hypothetical protein